MIERIISGLFGPKLPCGHGRWRNKPGDRKDCPMCGRHYLCAKFIGKHPVRAGVLLSQEEIEV